MTNEPDRNAAPDLFGNISEADRKTALDVFGKMLMETRDTAIIQWDQILAGKRRYAPWERLLDKFPDLDECSREVVREVLPHIVDTFIYCLLADLDASQAVRVSVASGNDSISNLARISWGLAAEPVGDDGWLVRFSKQRFEQPD